MIVKIFLKINISFFILTALPAQSQNFKTASFKTLPVAYVPCAFHVNFALYSTDSLQFVAFYDTLHNMTIAKRELSQTDWSFHKLNSKIGWDSHNYLSMAIDKNGIIHLAGNMHSSPLIYYQSQKAFDIYSLQAEKVMTGSEEDVMTYPEFMTAGNGDIIFHYRYGVSGSGYEVFNYWDADQRKWSRLLDAPLTDGLGKMNAYMQGPLLGPDNYFHILWVWRDTPDCATNHTLSYARSKDLLNWESIRAEKIKLPITINSKETWVDTTAVHGGLINIGIKVGFDVDDNVLIGYHKYDDNGNTQLYLARFENKKWISCQLSDWNYRWDFKGYGTIPNDLLIEPPRPRKKLNEIIFGFHHIKYGDGQMVLDNSTLDKKRSEEFETSYPKILNVIESAMAGMQVNIVYDKGKNTTKKFLLRWETQGPNRDQIPDSISLRPSLLKVVEY